MKARLGLVLTAIISSLILYSCMSKEEQEQQEQLLQNSEPKSVDVIKMRLCLPFMLLSQVVGLQQCAMPLASSDNIMQYNTGE